ncbi:MAG: biotin--[acetyl-CoA-carboxylase] ligase, partial [Pseudomonadota bacterium]|nr:biotin--[acetyl-CoA-carboxylase] ligase [Pseudomonadota bacterium]
MGLDEDVPNALFRLLGQSPASPLPELAQRLSVSTTIIADLLTRWQIEGLPLAGTGHDSPRLAPGFERLDAERIRAELDPQTHAWHRRLDCHPEVTSTNQVLLDRAREQAIDGHLCLAEHQRAGRGRQGRPWAMPWGAGLCLSLGFRLDPMSLPAFLGIAAGIGAVRAIRRTGLAAAGLKWPNDILFHDRKLGGILVETRVTPSGAGIAVVGIGINVAWPPFSSTFGDLPGDLGQPRIDIRTALGRQVSRNALAASVISEVCKVLHAIEVDGLESLRAEWGAYELVVGRPVRVLSSV